MTRKYQKIVEVDEERIEEVISILEVAIGECETIIPSDVLQDAVDYLELLSYERSWCDCEENMGR